MSSGVSAMRAPIEWPLLRIEWCVRHAAFGDEVVPDVNWMLIVSSMCSGESGSTDLVEFGKRISAKSVEARIEPPDWGGEELLTSMMF